MVADHVLFLSLGVAVIIGSICLAILKWYMSVGHSLKTGLCTRGFTPNDEFSV